MRPSRSAWSPRSFRFATAVFRSLPCFSPYKRSCCEHSCLCHLERRYAFPWGHIHPSARSLSLKLCFHFLNDFMRALAQAPHMASYDLTQVPTSQRRNAGCQDVQAAIPTDAFQDAGQATVLWARFLLCKIVNS